MFFLCLVSNSLPYWPWASAGCLCLGFLSAISAVHITITPVFLLTDEEVQVHIVAETVFGARHGLETFTQLVAADRPDFSDQVQCSLRLVAGAKIRDYPAYKHRGLVLDCSRHFIPLKDIKRTINGMAATKMNVFHWHVTDSQSFPLESRRVPQFTRLVNCNLLPMSEMYSYGTLRLLYSCSGPSVGAPVYLNQKYSKYLNS